LLKTGITANQFVVGVLAAAEVALDKRQRETGTVLLDIGSTTTGMAVFEEGEILHTAILPVGAAHITNDLAIGLQTDLDTAEHIKRTKIEADDSAKKNSKTHTVLEKDGKNERDFKQKDIDHIVKARLSELFGLVNAELKKIGRFGKLPGGAVIVGGGANLANIEIIAKEYLQLNAKTAKPHDFSGIIEAAGVPELTTAVGLMLDDMMSANGGGNSWNLGNSIAKGSSFARRLLDRLRP